MMAGSLERRRYGRLLVTIVTGAVLLAGFLVVADATPASATSSLPKISKFKANPKKVVTGNGTVSVSATISNAASCTLSSNPPVSGLPRSVSCSLMNQVIELPWNNSSGTPVKYAISLTAQGPGGTRVKTKQLIVEPGEGGFVFPSKITGTESGATGTDGITEYYPFDLTFEFDQNGPCVATSVCDYIETAISGSGGEYDPPPGTCEQPFPIDQSGASVNAYQAEFGPYIDGAEHLNFEAQTATIYTSGDPCFVALNWGLDHSVGDGDTSNDVWIPGATSLNATYDDGVTTGTIDFSFSYS